MKKKIIVAILTGTLIIGILSGCENSSQESTEITAQSEEITEEEEVKEEEAGTPHYEEGRACLYGLDGKEIDLKAAYTNFEKAVELGKTEANFYLGVLYYYFNYPEKDDQKAKTYFEAAGDNPYAQILLGEQYYYGDGVDEDKTKGLELIDATIAQGYMEGFTLSGAIAYDEEDYSNAFEYFNKVLESEELLFVATAMNYIGYMYEHGLGVEQDYAVALEWNEKAADLGSGAAMVNIGYMYEYGLGVEEDYAAALEWYQKAADLGSGAAMYNIGLMYEHGHGVEED